jgi:hypothetical protein
MNRHIEAFTAALQADDEGSDAETSGPTSPIIPPTPKPGRVRKISALSDFAPIQTKVKRSGCASKNVETDFGSYPTGRDDGSKQVHRGNLYFSWPVGLYS